MSLNYTTYVNSLANLLVVPSSDANFQTELPNIIDYAEQRIYRELDLLDTVVRDSTKAASTGTRNFSLPSALGTFLVVQQINIISPAGTINPENGTRNPAVPVSPDQLDWTFPSSTASTVPAYFARIADETIIFGPWPDQAYQVEVVGTIRPQPLSTSNVTTLLSVFFPDMLMAASMIKGAAYLKNFGAAVDDPKMAVTWESTYQALKASADVEEQRKKYFMAGTSSRQPAPSQTPPQT
jgi:hypothetical protein